MPLVLLLTGSGSRSPLAVPWHCLETSILLVTLSVNYFSGSPFHIRILFQVLFKSLRWTALRRIPGRPKDILCRALGMAYF